MQPRFSVKPAVSAISLVFLLLATGVSVPSLGQEDDSSAENLLENATSVEIPRKKVRGQVNGDSLKIRSAVIEGDELILHEGEDGAGTEVRIALFTEPGDNLTKRQFLVEPLDQLGVPMVTVLTDQGEEEHTYGYGMKLQFAKVKEGKLTGRIHLVLPDGESYLTGYFKAPYTVPTQQRAAFETEPMASPSSASEEMPLDLGGGDMADLGEMDMTGADAMAMGGPFAMGGPIGIVVLVLVGIGWLITMVGGIWMMVNAFKTSLLWGLAYLFLPFASLVWMVMHWADAKKPFLVSLAGCAVIFLGMGVGMVLG